MRSSTLPVKDALIPDAHDAVRRAARRLSDEQKPDGHWCAPLTADSTLESDYILLQLWLHAPEAGVWNPPTRGLVERAARAILERQLPDGGFSVYAGGPADASASVKAYTALKLAGLAEDDPRLGRARERILALGGIEAANSLRQDQPQPVRALPARAVPLGAAGDHAGAGAGLPHVGVDAGHRDRALGGGCGEPVPSRAGGLPAGRVAFGGRTPAAARRAAG